MIGRGAQTAIASVRQKIAHTSLTLVTSVKKKGHLKSVCKSKVTDKNCQVTVDVQQVGSVFTCSSVLPQRTTTTETIVNIYQRVGKQIWIKTKTNGNKLRYQWNTGSTCSMVGAEGYRQLGSPTCHPVSTSLMAYGGKSLNIKGQCFVNVKIGEQIQSNLMLIVVDEKGSNLLGLDWSDIFGLTNRGTSALYIVKAEYQPSQEFESEPLVSNSVKETRLLILQEKY